jgi:porin
MTRGISPKFLTVLLLGASASSALSRDAAADVPALSFNASYSGDFRRNTTGGLAVDDAYSHAADFGATWTTDGLFSAARMTTNFAVVYLGGKGISGEVVGDAQGLSNIEATRGWYLYESWVEFEFGAHANSLRAGVLDLNAEFDTPVTSGLFVSSPFGIGTDFSQTGERGPGAWPLTGLGIRAAGELNSRVQWRVGAYDGAPGSDAGGFTSTRVSSDEGALLVGEIEYSSERLHKLAFGTWSYTARFERVDSELNPAARARGNDGYYALVDFRLASVGKTDIDAALRVGMASSRFNVFDRYVGAAVTASHLWESRPGDALGLGVAYAHTGARYRALQNHLGQPATAGETCVELIYRAELAGWLSVLPSVQYVRDPGADPAPGDAWVAGVRFELSYDGSWQLSARTPAPADDAYARAQP